jgi:hypothetical protein
MEGSEMAKENFSTDLSAIAQDTALRPISRDFMDDARLALRDSRAPH